MNGRFPALSLPINPPLPPMESQPVDTLPSGAGWQYEPKWDGFRCLVFRDGRTVVLQSKAGEPLTRYFPEVVMAVASLPRPRFVLDAEIMVFGRGGQIAYEELMGRIHPSARRVAQLSAKTPATLLAFDLLAEGDESLLDAPLAERRKRLEKFFKGIDQTGVHLSPATAKRAEALGWLRDLAGAGLDGLIAKRKDEPYRSGEREGVVKMKPQRTCDCVVGGVRRAAPVQGGAGEPVSLLLGLYDDEGLLHFAGATGPLPPETRKALEKLLPPLLATGSDGAGFTGRTPGAEARASHAKTRDFDPLKPALVVEVSYDRWSGDRFRQNPAFVRFRPDKKPKQCTLDQVAAPVEKGAGFELIGL